MNQFLKILNLFILISLISIAALGTFYKHISFGWGLADMLGYFGIYITIIVHLILTIKYSKSKSPTYFVLPFAFLHITIFICLTATVLRGSEYKWNGSIFYLPCPTEISIRNKQYNGNKLVKICTSDYNSEFYGSWKEPFIIIQKGQVEIPTELSVYVKYPITQVIIESDHTVFLESDSSDLTYDFCFDNLKEEVEYKMTGTITGIQNNIPIIKIKVIHQM
jgi:hypothetical protein